MVHQRLPDKKQDTSHINQFSIGVQKASMWNIKNFKMEGNEYFLNYNINNGEYPVNTAR